MNRAQIFEIVLAPSQAAQFAETLALARQETGVSGIFATVCPTLDLRTGQLMLKLQVAKLDRSAVRKIQAALRNSFKTGCADH